MESLKSCPFCGQDAELSNNRGLVGCYKCCIFLPYGEWNQRATERESGAPTEAMEVTAKNLEEFLDKIGFRNYCCGCENDRYDIKLPFTATIALQVEDRPK